MIKKIIKQFVSFFGIGMVGTVMDLGTFTFLSFFGIGYLFATIVGNVIGAINNYVCNKLFTFKDKTKDPKGLTKQIIKYLGTVIVYMALTAGLMYVAVDVLYFNKFISRILILSVMVVINFIMNKYFVYENERKNI